MCWVQTGRLPAPAGRVALNILWVYEDNFKHAQGEGREGARSGHSHRGVAALPMHVSGRVRMRGCRASQSETSEPAHVV